MICVGGFECRLRVQLVEAGGSCYHATERLTGRRAGRGARLKSGVRLRWGKGLIGIEDQRQDSVRIQAAQVSDHLRGGWRANLGVVRSGLSTPDRTFRDPERRGPRCSRRDRRRLVISFRSDDRVTTHFQEEVDKVRRHPALQRERERAADRFSVPGDVPFRKVGVADHHRCGSPGCPWDAEQATSADTGSRCSPSR